MEIEPVVIYAETAATRIDVAQVDANVAKSDETRMTQTQNQSRTTFDGALLDLDESDFGATSPADDVILDLDFAEPVPGHGEATLPQQTSTSEDAAPAAMQSG